MPFIPESMEPTPISTKINTTVIRFAISGKTDSRTAGVGYGLLYGAIWWILGPLTLMPLMMGMGVAWTFPGAIQALPSLMGHLIYGGILGWTYGQLQCRNCAMPTLEAH